MHIVYVYMKILECYGLVGIDISNLFWLGERSYDAAKYFDNAVVRILIDDHNVPSLQQMLDYVQDVDHWLKKHKDNVIAIHCKGLCIGLVLLLVLLCLWVCA